MCSLWAFFESGWAFGDVFSAESVLISCLLFLGFGKWGAVLGHGDSDYDVLVNTFWYRPASISSFVKSATLMPGIWRAPEAPDLPCPFLQLESRHTLETPLSQWMQADACLSTKPLNQAHTQIRGVSNRVGLGLCWSIAHPTDVKISIHAQFHID